MGANVLVFKKDLEEHIARLQEAKNLPEDEICVALVGMEEMLFHSKISAAVK